MYTVFPKEDENELPQDFDTFSEAKEYAETLYCDFKIEYTDGEVE